MSRRDGLNIPPRRVFSGSLAVACVVLAPLASDQRRLTEADRRLSSVLDWMHAWPLHSAFPRLPVPTGGDVHGAY